MLKLKVLVPSLLIVMMMVVASGCGTGETPPDDPVDDPANGELIGKPLVIAENEHPQSFDPVLAYDSTVDRMVLLAYDSLIEYVPGSTDIRMAMAEDMEISEDGLTYYFKLRDGIQFHDGSQVTSQDVQYTFERARELNVGIASDLRAYDRVEIINDLEFEIILSEPYGPFYQFLPKVGIVNQSVVEANAGDDHGMTWLTTNTAGSGPYILTSFTPEVEARFARFDDYWRGWEDYQVDTVVWQFIKESTTQRLMLERGDIDIAQSPSIEDLPDLEGNADINVHIDDTLVQFYVFMNVERGPLADPRVRHAISYAYDYNGHIEHALAGLGVQAHGVIPTAMPFHNPDILQHNLDLDKARDLLADAGYPDGGFTLEISYLPVIDEQVRTVEILQTNLGQLGITLEAHGMTWPTFMELVSNRDTAPDLMCVYAFPSYADPNAIFYTNFHSDMVGGGFNYGWYIDDRADELIEIGFMNADPDVRAEAYAELQQQLVDDAVAINISGPSHVIAARSWVEGYAYNPSHHESVNVYEITLRNKP